MCCVPPRNAWSVTRRVVRAKSLRPRLPACASFNRVSPRTRTHTRPVSQSRVYTTRVSRRVPFGYVSLLPSGSGKDRWPWPADHECRPPWFVMLARGRYRVRTRQVSVYLADALWTHEQSNAILPEPNPSMLRIPFTIRPTFVAQCSGTEGCIACPL